MMKNLAGQEQLDGFAVESYEGCVSGSFDVAQETGRALAYGDEVLLIVQASVKPPRFKTDSNGDLKRVEVFAPNEAEIVLDGEVWGKIEAITGVLGTGGQHRLFNPRLDYSTGEIEGIPEGGSGFSDIGLDEEGKIILTDEEQETLAKEHAAARDRARAAAAASMDDDDDTPYAGSSRVERVDDRPAGSQDPVLRRFLMEAPSGR